VTSFCSNEITTFFRPFWLKGFKLRLMDLTQDWQVMPTTGSTWVTVDEDDDDGGGGGAAVMSG
jgi:hypothetical protein